MVQAAITAAEAGDIVVLKPGSYAFAATRVDGKAGVTVWAYGATFTSTLDGTSGNDRVIAIDGSEGSNLDLTADAAIGDLAVSVSSDDAATLAAGDHIRVSDATTNTGAIYHDERNIVDSVSGTTVNLKYPLNFAYTTAESAKVRKVTPAEDFHWRGGTFDLADTTGEVDAIQGTLAYGCTVEDVLVKHHTGKAVQFWQSLECHVDRVRGENPISVTAGLGYVVDFVYCRFCSNGTAYGESVRHIVNITGGSDVHGGDVLGGGRTTDDQAAAFLHGLGSRRCSFGTITVNNMQTAFAAGNGTFANVGDFDFHVEKVIATECDDTVLITNGCTGWDVTVKATRAVIRAAAITDSDGILRVDCDTITTNPSNYGAVSISGTSNVDGWVKARNTIYHAVQWTGSGIVNLDVDIDMGSVAATGVACTPTAGEVNVSGRIALNNSTSAIGVELGGTATAANVACKIVGSCERGVYAHGTYTAIEIDSYIPGASGAECVRLDNQGSSVHIKGGLLGFSTGLRTTGTTTSVRISSSVKFTGSTKILNSAAAAILTGEGTQAPTYSSSITPDAFARWQTITVTNTTAFTINAPTSAPDSTGTRELTIEILNSSGGAMGTITWNAAFVFNGFTWANPASTKKRFARFEWNGAKWVCTALAGADY